MNSLQTCSTSIFLISLEAKSICSGQKILEEFLNPDFVYPCLFLLMYCEVGTKYLHILKVMLKDYNIGLAIIGPPRILKV